MDSSDPPHEAAARVLEDTMARARHRLAALERVREDLAALGEHAEDSRRRGRLLDDLTTAFGGQQEAT